MKALSVHFSNENNLLPKHEGLSFGLQTFVSDGLLSFLFEHHTFPPHSQHGAGFIPEVPFVSDFKRSAAV